MLILQNYSIYVLIHLLFYVESWDHGHWHFTWNSYINRHYLFNVHLSYASPMLLTAQNYIKLHNIVMTCYNFTYFYLLIVKNVENNRCYNNTTLTYVNIVLNYKRSLFQSITINEGLILYDINNINCFPNYLLIYLKPVIIVKIKKI